MTVAIPDGQLFQNAVYVGVNMQDILYGVELVLYFNTMLSLLARDGDRKKADVFYAVFSTVMLLLITVWIFTQAIFGEKMWLLDANYPGGPDAYWAANISVWYMNLGTTSITILQLMTDALMIYRCYIIWNNYRVVVIPIVLWITTLVLGVMIFFHTSVPGGDFFSGVAVHLGLAYYSVSVFSTAVLTCLICYRMVRHGKMIKEQLGKDFASPYFAIVTLVVESVLPQTLTGIAFLVAFGIGSHISIGFSCVYIMFMCISPQMLILRVASGRSFTGNSKDVKTPLTIIKFSPLTDVMGTGSQPGSPNSGVHIHLQNMPTRKKDENV